MNADGSVTYLLMQLKVGNTTPVQPLWEAYYCRLVGLARKKLLGVPCQVADEEDVALSAFKSFCEAVKQGRFPRLDDRNDLWKVLMLLTIRKASDARKRENRKKRSGGKVQHFSAIQNEDSSAHELGSRIRHRQEPNPEYALELAEEFRRLLGLLNSADLQAVAVWKMEGFTNEEIATKLGRSLGTVERKLRLIRQIWNEELRS